MNVVALVDGPEHVCCRYRVAAFRPWLEARGHALELRAWPKRWWSRLRIGAALRDADVVIWQRKLLAPWQLYLLRCAAPRLVFDFDDAIYLRDSYAPKGAHSARRLHRFMAAVETADAVFAGNAFLADEARRWAPAGHVRVAPTCVDPSRYRPAEHRRTEAVELVWVGSASTLRGVETARPLWEALGHAVPGLRLRLVCDQFLTLRNITVLPRPWSETREVDEIASGDIGVSWVPDDLWSRGKCGLKVLQYMAAGLPVVANSVGVQADLVRDGVTGFLCRNADDWIDAVRLLAADPDLRRRMGAAGRRRVEAEFDIASGAERWLALLDGFRKPTSGKGAA